jgi:two-component system, chemotaxis family, sensor kinase Cph1
LQLFQNMLGNAIKFRGREPPHIRLGAEQNGNECKIWIRDNGIGIHPQYAIRIFGMFRRLHTRADYVGSGLGLAICKRIVERYGGQIWVESEEGKGATFYFTLPAGGKEKEDASESNI